MGKRMRPIAEMGQPSGELELVTCWRCQERMEVRRTVTRATCPGCGSRVAIHRLRMPMLPSVRERVRQEVPETARWEGVIRLGEGAGPGPEGTSRGIRRGKRELKPMPQLESGKAAPILTEEEAVDRRRVEAKFEPSQKVEEVRERLFVEAAPRMAGIEDGPGVGGRVTRVVLFSVVLCAGLILLVTVLGLRGG